MRLVLKFAAFGSCWPFGQADYRTGVSIYLDYGRRCTGAEGGPGERVMMLRLLEGFGEFLPLPEQRGMGRFMLAELLSLLLAFFGADEIL